MFNVCNCDSFLQCQRHVSVTPQPGKTCMLYLQESKLKNSSKASTQGPHIHLENPRPSTNHWTYDKWQTTCGWLCTQLDHIPDWGLVPAVTLVRQTADTYRGSRNSRKCALPSWVLITHWINWPTGIVICSARKNYQLKILQTWCTL